jgi:hypothetical protein
MNFTFSVDDSKPLTVGLQAIQAKDTFKGVVSLLPSGILTVIDSTVPEIVGIFYLIPSQARTDASQQWLPTSACSIFETAFNLTYDPHTPIATS